MPLALLVHRTFTRAGPTPPGLNHRGHPNMFDILIAVLGTGGILLMAGYAALCDRI